MENRNSSGFAIWWYLSAPYFFWKRIPVLSVYCW